MARSEKEAAVAELTEDFRSASATVLTEYRGLTVSSMKELRRSLGTDTKYSVVKNTLTLGRCGYGSTALASRPAHAWPARVLICRRF